MTKEPVVAILGATGAVGQEFIRLIGENSVSIWESIIRCMSGRVWSFLNLKR